MWQGIYRAYTELFQFHYGTIKSLYTFTLLAAIAHFNSTMVRLKVNSILVKHFISDISIPLWYD